jgi:hypothetical protein
MQDDELVLLKTGTPVRIRSFKGSYEASVGRVLELSLTQNKQLKQAGG